MTFNAEAYRSFARLTDEMASLAEAQDFETLSSRCIDFEQKKAALNLAAANSAGEVAQVEEAIRSILDNQRRISEYAGPWLSQVRILLREGRQEKTLIDAYRSSF